MYDGPLKVPNKRAKKDPLAPKRAMSAFLHFSQSMRPRLRETYPEAKNMDMSKMLGQVRRTGVESSAIKVLRLIDLVDAAGLLEVGAEVARLVACILVLLFFLCAR